MEALGVDLGKQGIGQTLAVLASCTRARSRYTLVNTSTNRQWHLHDPWKVNGLRHNSATVWARISVWSPERCEIAPATRLFESLDPKRGTVKKTSVPVGSLRQMKWETSSNHPSKSSNKLLQRNVFWVFKTAFTAFDLCSFCFAFALARHFASWHPPSSTKWPSYGVCAKQLPGSKEMQELCDFAWVSVFLPMVLLCSAWGLPNEQTLVQLWLLMTPVASSHCL